MGWGRPFSLCYVLFDKNRFLFITKITRDASYIFIDLETLINCIRITFPTAHKRQSLYVTQILY